MTISHAAVGSIPYFFLLISSAFLLYVNASCLLRFRFVFLGFWLSEFLLDSQDVLLFAYLVFIGDLSESFYLEISSISHYSWSLALIRGFGLWNLSLA